jgi:hypothetical protein
MTAPAIAAVEARLQAEAEAERRRRLRARAAATATMPGWAHYYRRIDDQPFSLARFRPLEALYADDHPHIVVIKPAQRGISEYAINLACFALDRGADVWETGKNGLNVGYLFPTLAALQDFAKERFSGLKDESPGLRALFGAGDFDAVTFKQVGHSYLYLRGAWSESALLSFACDLLILDEFDRMDAKAKALASKRLNASVVQREVDISTPTLPGQGIHAAYLASDQQVWETQCGHCGAWHSLDFFRDVRADGEPWDVWRSWPAERLAAAALHTACPGCRQPFDRCGPGRWVAQRPEVTTTRGYHIPWWPFPVVKLEKLAQSAIKTEPNEVEEFFRSDLGLPYQPGGSRVTLAMIDQLAGPVPTETTWSRTTMGIDVGARFHYRISSSAADGRRIIRAMGSVGSWERLSELMRRYQVRHCVIDAMPELHACAEWAASHPGRVLRAFYQDTAGVAIWKLGGTDEAPDGTVRIHRTFAMDATFASLADAGEVWPVALTKDPEVRAHLTAPVRVTVADKRGQEQPSWVHTAPDHFYHACVYDQIALATLPKPAVPLLRGKAKIPGVRV